MKSRLSCFVGSDAIKLRAMLAPFPGLEDVRIHIEVEFRPWEWAMEAEPDVIETRVAEVRFVVWPGTNHAVPLCSIPDAPNFGQAVIQYARLRPWRLQDPNVLRDQSEDVARSAPVVGPEGDKPKTLEEVVKQGFQILPSGSTVEEDEVGLMCNLAWLHVIDLPELSDFPHSVLTMKYEWPDHDNIVCGSFLLCTWCSQEKVADVGFVSPWNKQRLSDDYEECGYVIRIRFFLDELTKSNGATYNFPPPKENTYPDLSYVSDIPTNVPAMRDTLLAEWQEPDSSVRYAWECFRLEGEARLRYATGYDGDFGELQHIMELVSRLAAFYYAPAFCLRDFRWHFTCVAPMNDGYNYRWMVFYYLTLGHNLDTESLRWESPRRFYLPSIGPGKGWVWDNTYTDEELEANFRMLDWFAAWNDLLHAHFVPRCWQQDPRNLDYTLPRWGQGVIGHIDQVGDLGFVDFSKIQTGLLWPIGYTYYYNQPRYPNPPREEGDLSSHEKIELSLQLVDAHHEPRAWLEGKASQKLIDYLLCKEDRLEFLESKPVEFDFLRNID